MARKAPDPQKDRAQRLKAMASVAARFRDWAPASEVLTSVRAVPTVFPQLNVATRVGGWPIERVTMVHGPSNHGKSLLALGLGASFLQKDHYFGFVDAEFTTPIDWPRKLLGPELCEHPGFMALRPSTYEQTVEAVRSFVTTLAGARDKGELDKETSALLVVDSLAKLVPKDITAKLAKESLKDGVDGMSGRAAMISAAMNASWLKELVPLLYHTHTALLIIARESEKVNAKAWEADWKVGGGKAPFYDSSLVCRVTREFVKEVEGDETKVVGERHQVRILKTKIGGKEGKYTDAYFYTQLDPVAFDPASDVLDMALACGVVMKKSGKHWVDDTGEVFASSAAEAVRTLRSNSDLRFAIESAAALKYQPEEVDAEGEAE